MSDSIGIVSSSVGAISSASFAAPVSTQAQAPVVPSVAAAATGLVHNPRVVQDPKAGFITEYLSSNGSEVISQSPSLAVVAYLRLGLSAEGLPKDTTTSVSTTA